ncbi:MAG: LuxR C-terminal-related transcriptional regulator [Anaerolineae bacterium]
MFDALLPTKLHLPTPRANRIPRPRLLTKLAIRPETRLVLISAPAGYGKTTLAAAWVRRLEASGDAQVCWLALDDEDNDPAQFFRYIAAAVQPLPGVQALLPQLLQAGQPLPPSTLLKAFLQDISAVSTPFVLVLDDYHAIDTPAIDEALAALLERQPPQMTLALTSRSDPGFPLSRLRARGQLIELRADDLRFTGAEAAQFLQQTMGLALSPGQVAALEQRTEGWVAGLQMAGLSMQNRADSELDSFVDGFTGSHRFVLDYLVEETLSQQPEPVAGFLLATAILGRLYGPLCDAVTGQAGGQALLERLERDNLFVVPLDDERRWYRYHHLFADGLRAHALQTRPNQVKVWHRRAGDWFARQQSNPEAIRHFLAAGDFAEAARLLELIRPAIDGTYLVAQWLNWAQSLPEPIVRERPVLCAGYGWALLENGDLPAAEIRLRQAEEWLNAATAKMVVADEAAWQTLPASLAAARAYQELARGDVAGAASHAHRALELSPGEEHQWHRAALSLLGLTGWINGDLTGAARAFAGLTDSALTIGKQVDAISTAYVLAEMEIGRGRLNRAEEGLQQVLQSVTRRGQPPPLGVSDLYRVQAELARERGEWDTARRHLRAAAGLGEQAALINWRHRLRLTEARLRQSQGDLDGALALLAEADELYVENPLPEVQPVAALKARIWLAQGALELAQAWAGGRGLSPADEPVYLREFEHLTLARLLLARHQLHGEGRALDEALALLARLLAAAEAGDRNGSVIEILILQALALAARNDTPAALPPLARALALAEPEGYLRRFVDEGPPLAALLRAATAAEMAGPYAARLLAAFGDAPPESPAAAQPQPLAEPLSERELEILGLIAAGLKNQEIADRLVISLNTVLYHTKNIYGKLGVNRRTLAVAKAGELGLL